jgi:hypothetical protein
MDLFALMPIIFTVFIVLFAIAMIAHMVLFGTVFGVVAKRIADAAEHQQNLQAAQLPQPCTYCGTTLLAHVEECPGCGAKRVVAAGRGT